MLLGLSDAGPHIEELVLGLGCGRCAKMQVVHLDKLHELPGLTVAPVARDRVNIICSDVMLEYLRAARAKLHVSARPWDGPKATLECDEFVGTVRVDFFDLGGVVRIGKCGTLNAMIGCYREVNVRIGHLTTINGARMSVMDSEVILGNDCMLADNITFQPNDQHAVFDLENLKKLNLGKNIVVEDHVWIGIGACLLAGARVGRGAIIGAGSIVTSEIPPFSLAVGVPARVIRENVSWSRGLNKPDAGTLAMRDLWRKVSS